MANQKNRKPPSKGQKKSRKVSNKTVKSKTAVKAPKTPARQKKTVKPLSARPSAKRKGSFKKEIRKRLLSMREELLAEVNQKVKAETDPDKFEIGDMYDIASAERDRELSLILGDRERERLASIQDALARLEDATYGMCEECGEPIGEERLKILPFTKVCVECKTKNEREHGVRRKYEEETGFSFVEKSEMEEEF